MTPLNYSEIQKQTQISLLEDQGNRFWKYLSLMLF